MFGRRQASESQNVERDRPIAFGGMNAIMPTNVLPQNLVLGPKPGIAAESLHNIDNSPYIRPVQQYPVPTHNTMLSKIRSHYTVLPIGKRYKAPSGSV